MSSLLKDTKVLKELAKTVEMPHWATHVAVRTDGSKVEPAVWEEKTQEYLDEEITDPDKWYSSYKKPYWKFFSREELA